MYDEGVAIVMPYFHCGSLESVAPRLSMEQVKLAIRQILNALRYLHGQGQIHRDIKPTNILVRNEDPLELVVADFGLVSVANPLTCCGTEGYMAPEILRNREKRNPTPYTNAVDIYALGVLLLYCVGVELQPGPVLNQKNSIRHIGSTIDQAVADSKDIQRRGALLLASDMLTHGPNDRLSVEQCLQHPWLNPWYYIPYVTVHKRFKDHARFELETRPENNPTQAIALFGAFEHYLGDQSPSIEQIAYILKNLKTLKQAIRHKNELTEEEHLAAVLTRLPSLGGLVDIPWSISQSDRVPYCVTKLFQQIRDGVGDILAQDPKYKDVRSLRHRAKAANRPMQEISSKQRKSPSPKLDKGTRARQGIANDSVENPEPGEPTGIRARLRPRSSLPASDRMDISGLSLSIGGKSQALDRMELDSQ